MKPKPHPHAALIAEWIKDMNRKVEVNNPDDGLGWMASNCPAWFPDFLYRFADTAPQKHRIVSSLTDDELFLLRDIYGDEIDNYRAIANAAAQRAIGDLPHPPDPWLDRYGIQAGLASVVIEEYIRDLKEGKL